MILHALHMGRIFGLFVYFLLLIVYREDIESLVLVAFHTVTPARSRSYRDPFKVRRIRYIDTV